MRAVLKLVERLTGSVVSQNLTLAIHKARKRAV
jgi:hypothetical protein